MLLDAVKKFPRDALTRFNLECYAYRMEELKLANEWIQQPVGLDAKFKILALDNSGLEPLWDSLN